MKKLLLFFTLIAFPVFAGTIVEYDTTGIPGNVGSAITETNGQVYTNGVALAGSGGGGSGTVTSVTFTGNGVVDSATPSSAVTGSGSVTATLKTQSANTVFGNFTGSTAAPTFSAAPVFSGALLTALNASSISSGTVPIANLPVGTASAKGILEPDGTTVTVSSGTISVPTATSSVLGLVKPDGSTITVTAGAIAIGNHSAALLTSGSVADARLSANVPLINATANNFTGITAANQLTVSNTAALSSLTVTNGMTNNSIAGGSIVATDSSHKLISATAVATSLLSGVVANAQLSSQSVVSTGGSTQTITRAAMQTDEQITLSANLTISFSGLTDGDTFNVAIINTASNWTVTWPSLKWSGGSAPTQTTGAHTDFYTFHQINGIVYGSVVQNF